MKLPTASPSGPARSRYNASASTTPMPISTTPTRSCSLPATARRSSAGVESRRRVDGGVRSRVDPGFDEADLDCEEPLFGAARPDPPVRVELWARGFFEGPHVFIVESTVPMATPHGGASAQV